MAEQKPDGGKPGGGPLPKNRPANRIYTFSFTLPKLLFGVLFSVLALTWVFIFGIMLGRGHKPEEQVPKLARMMPSALSSRNATLAPPPPAEVLKLEELKYQDTLKGRTVASAPPKPVEQPKPKVVEPPKPKKPEPKPAAKPEPAKPTASSAKEQPPKPAAKETPQAKTAAKETPKAQPGAPKPDPKAADKAKAESTTGRFDYVYQVAAFKDAPPAEAMRAKLQGAGIKARVEKSQEGAVTWYRIMVPFRGKPEDTRSLRASLAQQGIPRVILHSKKALD